MEDKIRRNRVTQPAAPADPSVGWSAKLLAPASAVRRDSKPQYHIAVDAPVVLDGAVHVGVQPRSGRPVWIAGEWLGDAGQHRTAIATPQRTPPGLHRVVVRVGDMTVDAGSVVVT